MAMGEYNGFSAAQRTKAQKWLNEQWKAGTLPKPCQCAACGQTRGVIQAHAEDYSEPFMAGKTDQYHLCYRCHMIIHCRFRSIAQFKAYCQTLKTGERFVPLFYTDWDTFKKDHLLNYGRGVGRERITPRDVCLLEQMIAVDELELG